MIGHVGGSCHSPHRRNRRGVHIIQVAHAETFGPATSFLRTLSEFPASHSYLMELARGRPRRCIHFLKRGNRLQSFADRKSLLEERHRCHSNV